MYEKKIYDALFFLACTVMRSIKLAPSVKHSVLHQTFSFRTQSYSIELLHPMELIGRRALKLLSDLWYLFSYRCSTPDSTLLNLATCLPHSTRSSLPCPRLTWKALEQHATVLKTKVCSVFKQEKRKANLLACRLWHEQKPAVFNEGVSGVTDIPKFSKGV